MSLTEASLLSRGETTIQRLWPVQRPYLFLVGILLLVFLALAAIGLDLGFVGDVLAYEYHYDRLGTRGGMNWLVNVEWQRHLLASIYSAPIHVLFPGQSAAWYGLAFLIHFANGVMVFLLVDTILRGRRRWIAFSAALIFVFHALQIVSHFEFPTGSHRKAALFLAMLSLWLYIQWIRHGRQGRWWRDFSLVTYMVAVASYEQTAFFFLLHPIVAYYEDRHNHAVGNPFRWLIGVGLDSLWYPLFFAAYMFVLNQLFVQNDHVTLSIGRLVEQAAGALNLEFSPAEFWSRLSSTFQSEWLLLTGAVGAGLFVTIWVWSQRAALDTEPRADTSSASGELLLVILGAAIVAVTILAVAPTDWALSGHPRLIYPDAVGIAMAVSGGLALLVARMPNAAAGRALFGLAVALLVAPGVTRLFQVQQDYIRENVAREAVKAAILQAVPSWKGDVPPYILIVSDAHPSRDLALHAQDVKFPLMFDMMYGMDGIAADAIYPDVPASAAPAPDLPGSRYNGPFIVVEPEGIYSPLAPGIPIDPSRLVILFYDSQTKTARVLDELPPDVLATANIVQRAPMEWRTNHDLIGP